MNRAWCVLGLVVLVACGSEGKKARTSCTDDGGCSGGVCFEQECYTACSATEPCADDELCVRKERSGAEVDLCLVNAEYYDAGQGECINAQPDCDGLVRGVCQVVGCHDRLCAVEPMNDGILCETRTGGEGTCAAGVCLGASTGTCLDPAGTWVGSVTHPEDEARASCVIDNQVTQQITLVISPAADGQFAATVETTNNVDPDSGECFTYTEEWTDGVFQDGVVHLEKTHEEMLNCNDSVTPVPVNVTFGFDGALSADCTQITGTSWKEPADACNPDSGRWEEGGVVFTKVTDTSHAAFR